MSAKVWRSASRSTGSLARGGLSHARLGERGGRCRPGSLAAPEPHRRRRGREPRRLADDRRRARVAEHAPPARLRREEPLGVRMPEPIVDRADGMDPEHEALVADSVGLALLVVLETLSPPERVAFVLHDIFAVPFDEIAPIVDRSPEAARQLASRARRRVQGENTVPDADLGTQRRVVDAFLAAARDGDFEGLLAVLDPDVVLRRDVASARRIGRGPWARGRSPVRRLRTHGLGTLMRPALVNGAVGASDPRRRAFLRRGVHGQGREDRRDRHPCRAGTAPSARSDGPRR